MAMLYFLDHSATASSCFVRLSVGAVVSSVSRVKVLLAVNAVLWEACFFPLPLLLRELLPCCLFPTAFSSTVLCWGVANTSPAAVVASTAVRRRLFGISSGAASAVVVAANSARPLRIRSESSSNAFTAFKLPSAGCCCCLLPLGPAVNSRLRFFDGSDRAGARVLCTLFMTALRCCSGVACCSNVTCWLLLLRELSRDRDGKDGPACCCCLTGVMMAAAAMPVQPATRAAVVVKTREKEKADGRNYETNKQSQTRRERRARSQLARHRVKWPNKQLLVTYSGGDPDAFCRGISIQVAVLQVWDPPDLFPVDQLDSRASTRTSDVPVRRRQVKRM